MSSEDRIRQVIASVFDTDAARLNDDDSPRTIAAWDSVNHIHLVLALEAEFGIQFDPGEVAGLTSVGLIRKRIEGAPSNG
jgi:acyl carrier protein